MATNKKCVKAYLNESDYKRLKQFAVDRDVSISAVIAGLLHFYQAYHYFPGCDYNFKTGAWDPDRDKSD